MAENSLTPEQRVVAATARKEAALADLKRTEEGLERAKNLAKSDSNLRTLSANLEKAQAAKAQFEESVAKFQAAKAKAEKAVAKAKEVRRKVEETSRLIKSTPPSKAGLAGLVASQVGAMRGALVAQVQKRVLEALTKFTNECPNTKEIQKIIKTKNNLTKNINSLQKRVAVHSGAGKKAIGIATTVKLAITVIKQIPLPTAVIPPMSGGLGIPVSVLNKYSDKLIQLDKLATKYSEEGTAVLSIVDSITPVLDNVKNRLNSIDIAIQQCVESAESTADLTMILNQAQPKGNTGTEGTPLDSQGEPDPKFNYKGYQLKIIQDPNSPKIAPRRYAVAIDRRGIIVLKGQPSFSSSTDVLLDEIKFRIDNQLP